MKKNGLWKWTLRRASIIACSGLLLLSGCGKAESATDSYNGSSGYMSVSNSKSAAYKDDALWSEGVMAEEAIDYDLADEGGYVAPGKGGDSSENLANSSVSKRKLIKNVNMSVETQEYDILMSKLEIRIKELGGYIQNLDSYNGSVYPDYNYNQRATDTPRQRRYANMTIRIPQNKLDEFIGSVSELGNVLNRRENVEDVTLQYVDVQSHKESLLVEQKRLLELLEKAENLEDIITLENRLSNIRYQIESMESTLRTFDDQVDYSTVQLNVNEVEIYTPVEIEEKSAIEKTIEGFCESLVDVKNMIVDFFMWLVIKLPYLVMYGFIIFLIVKIIRSITLGKKARKQAQLEGRNYREVLAEMKKEKKNKKIKKQKASDALENQQDETKTTES